MTERQFNINQKNKGNISRIETKQSLKEYIIEKLKEDWYPEEISGRIQVIKH